MINHMVAWILAGLSAGTATVVGGLWRSRYERANFVTETFCIQSPKIQEETTLVFLTDLHSQVFGEANEALIDAIAKAEPDYILSGGDAMVVKQGEADCTVPLDLFGKLAKRWPLLCANGNHETRMKEQRSVYQDRYQTYQRELRKQGVHLLVSGSYEIKPWLRVSTVELENRFYKDGIPAKMEPSYLSGKLGKADASKFEILLLHSPLFFKACRQWGADLTLSGHFHGGTIRLPLLGGVMTPQYQFFHPKCAGFFEKDGRYLLVGRGLGTHSINIRIGNRPQLVVLRLLPQGKEAK